MQVFIHDDLDPQTTAMMQALYSRSPKSVQVHREAVSAEGAEKFMAKFYVGYGHKSIGDCGSTTLFVEDVSMLAAKALQHSPLYNGQEASTRYLSFVNPDGSYRPCVNPLPPEPSPRDLHGPSLAAQGDKILARWMKLYEKALEVLVPAIAARHPREEEQSETVWRNAVKARAFDIARGFLPAGMTTNVSWHTTLSHARDHVADLCVHPLEEVRSMGAGLLAALRHAYPASFEREISPESKTYRAEVAKRLTYSDLPAAPFSASHRGHAFCSTEPVLNSRPKGSLIPRAVSALQGTFSFRFPLDFGSFRDVQRHRACYQAMPLLTPRRWHWWYQDQLQDLVPEFAREARLEVSEIQSLLRTLDTKVSRENLQYFCGMGFEVQCLLDADLRSAVYIAELRSQQTVHPTLRPVAQQMGEFLRSSGIPVYVDHDPDKWSVKRGTQTIVEKEGASA